MDEIEQYQARDYLDKYYTDGVHWGVKAGVVSNSEARKVWEAIVNISKRGYYYPRAINGEHIISVDNAVFFVKADYRNPYVSKIIRFNEDFEVNSGCVKELIINAKGHPTRHREALRAIEDFFGEGYVSEYNSKIYKPDAWKNRGREREDGRGIDQEVQDQERTSPLTDRDVLEAAANDVGIFDMSDAEQTALQSFKDRLVKIRQLQKPGGCIKKSSLVPKWTDRRPLL